MNFEIGTITFAEIDSSAPGRRVWGILPATLPNLSNWDPYAGTLEIAHTKGSNGKPDRHLIKVTYKIKDNDGVDVPMSLHSVFTIGSTGTSPSELITDIQTADIGIRDVMVNLLSDTSYVLLANLLSGFYEGEEVTP